MESSKLFTSVDKQPTFKCPHCKKLISHRWRFSEGPTGQIPRDSTSNSNGKIPFSYSIKGVVKTFCNSCNEPTYWLKFLNDQETLIFPHQYDYPDAHDDLPDEIKVIYDQAGKTMSISVGASAALSRVCLEQLLIHLGYEKGSVNDKIGEVIKDNMVSSQTAKMLDTIRHFGNTGAHTGTINLNESEGIAQYILTSINTVVDELITKPKQVDSFFNLLPEKVRESIKNRDTKS